MYAGDMCLEKDSGGDRISFDGWPLGMQKSSLSLPASTSLQQLKSHIFAVVGITECLSKRGSGEPGLHCRGGI